MGALRKPFDLTYVPAQPAREASGGYTQCGYFITGYGPPREVNCRVIGYYPSNGMWIPQYICNLVRDPIYTYKCEYIPYVPASPGAPARIETTPRFGWDAGAQSVVSHNGDCQLEFSVDPVVGAYVGLSADSGDVTDISRFRYAFYLHQANYQNQYAVIVDGAQCTAPAPYTAETVFKIRRLGEKVEFRVGDAVVHIDEASKGPLYAATTVYAPGDAVPELDSCCTPSGDIIIRFVSRNVGYKGDFGALGVYYWYDGAASEDVGGDEAFAAALAAATSVRIVKIAPTRQSVCDVPYVVGDPYPNVTFTDVNWECSREDGPITRGWGYMLGGVGIARDELVWVVLDVDGTLYYGACYNNSWFPCGE